MAGILEVHFNQQLATSDAPIFSAMTLESIDSVGSDLTITPGQNPVNVVTFTNVEPTTAHDDLKIFSDSTSSASIHFPFGTAIKSSASRFEICGHDSEVVCIEETFLVLGSTSVVPVATGNQGLVVKATPSDTNLYGAGTGNEFITFSTSDMSFSSSAANFKYKTGSTEILRIIDGTTDVATSGIITLAKNTSGGTIFFNSDCYIYGDISVNTMQFRECIGTGRFAWTLGTEDVVVISKDPTPITNVISLYSNPGGGEFGINYGDIGSISISPTKPFCICAPGTLRVEYQNSGNFCAFGPPIVTGGISVNDDLVLGKVSTVNGPISIFNTGSAKLIAFNTSDDISIGPMIRSDGIDIQLAVSDARYVQVLTGGIERLRVTKSATPGTEYVNIYASGNIQGIWLDNESHWRTTTTAGTFVDVSSGKLTLNDFLLDTSTLNLSNIVFPNTTTRQLSFNATDKLDHTISRGRLSHLTKLELDSPNIEFFSTIDNFIIDGNSLSFYLEQFIAPLTLLKSDTINPLIEFTDTNVGFYSDITIENDTDSLKFGCGGPCAISHSTALEAVVTTAGQNVIFNVNTADYAFRTTNAVLSDYLTFWTDGSESTIYFNTNTKSIHSNSSLHFNHDKFFFTAGTVDIFGISQDITPSGAQVLAHYGGPVGNRQIGFYFGEVLTRYLLFDNNRVILEHEDEVKLFSSGASYTFSDVVTSPSNGLHFYNNTGTSGIIFGLGTARQINSNTTKLTVNHDVNITLDAPRIDIPTDQLYIDGVLYEPNALTYAPVEILKSELEPIPVISIQETYTDTITPLHIIDSLNFGRAPIDATIVKDISTLTYITGDTHLFSIGNTTTNTDILTLSDSKTLPSGITLHNYKLGVTNEVGILFGRLTSTIESTVTSTEYNHATVQQFNINNVEFFRISSSDTVLGDGLHLYHSGNDTKLFFNANANTFIDVSNTRMIIEHPGYVVIQTELTEVARFIDNIGDIPNDGITLLHTGAEDSIIFRGNINDYLTFSNTGVELSHESDNIILSPNTTQVVGISTEDNVNVYPLLLYHTGVSSGINFFNSFNYEIDVTATRMAVSHTGYIADIISGTEIFRTVNGLGSLGTGISAFKDTLVSGFKFLGNINNSIATTSTSMILSHPNYIDIDRTLTNIARFSTSGSSSLGGGVHVYNTGTEAGFKLIGSINNGVYATSTVTTLSHTSRVTISPGAEVTRITQLFNTTGAYTHLYASSRIGLGLGSTGRYIEYDGTGAMVLEDPAEIKININGTTSWRYVTGVAVTEPLDTTDMEWYLFNNGSDTAYMHMQNTVGIDPTGVNVFTDIDFAATIIMMEPIAGVDNQTTLLSNGILTGMSQTQRDNNQIQYYAGLYQTTQFFTGGLVTPDPFDIDGAGFLITRKDLATGAVVGKLWLRGDDGRLFVDDSVRANQTVTPSFTGGHPVQGIGFTSIRPGMAVKARSTIMNPNSSVIPILTSAIPICEIMNEDFSTLLYGIYSHDEQFDDHAGNYNLTYNEDGELMSIDKSLGITFTKSVERSIVASIGEGACIVILEEGEELVDGCTLVSSKYGCMQIATPEKVKQWALSKYNTTDPFEIMFYYNEVVKYKALATDSAIELNKREYNIVLPENSKLMFVPIVM